MKPEIKSQLFMILQRLKLLKSFASLFVLLSCPLAQSQTTLESEFNSIITSLETVRESNCSGAVNWQQGKPSPLNNDQIALFRRAYLSALDSDEEMLKLLVAKENSYQDIYGFIESLRSLVLDNRGIMFLYQQRFDPSIRQHRVLTERFDGFEPDVLVNIVWCNISSSGGDIQQTGGFAYLSLINGEWKFDSP